jgi:hypothetical protein
MNTTFDQRHIRRAFSRSAGSYDAAAVAQAVQQFMRQISFVGAT